MADDFGNIELLEHININTDLPLECCAFFIDGLGFSQDPRQGEAVGGLCYVNGLLWVNAGLTQVHLPVTSRGAPGALQNRLDGVIGLGYLQEDIDSALPERLAAVEPRLRHTRFSWGRLSPTQLEVTDPMGNRYLAEARPRSARDTRGHHPGPVSLCLGITYVEVSTTEGVAQGIADFYQRYLGARAWAPPGGGLAVVRCGPGQELRFVERAGKSLPMQETEPYQNAAHGLHVAIYLRDLMAPMQAMATDGLLWGNPRFTGLDRSFGLTQFRFKDITTLTDAARERLHELEHEVRGFEHPGSPFRRREPFTLVGREPVQELVSAVTDEFEYDFEAHRAAAMASTHKGFVPQPPAVRHKPT